MQPEMENKMRSAGTQSSAADVEARLPHKSGYGDFCFDLLKRPQISIAEDRSLENHEIERKGPFNLFGLPRELRLRIFHYVLEPVVQYCDKTDRNFIEILLLTPQRPLSFRLPRPGDEPPWTDFSQKTLNSIGKPAQCLFTLGLIPLQPSQEAGHPERLSDYKLKLVRGASTTTDAEHWRTIQKIRNLANASHHIREEFGSVLWKRVHLNCQTPADLHELPFFLQKRPAAYSGIKTLSLRLSLDSSGLLVPPQEDETMKTLATIQEFHEAIREVSNSLCLESLSVILELRARQFKRLASQDEGKWLDAIRSLHVAESFDLKFRAAREPYNQNPLPTHWAKLEEIWGPAIRNWITPNTIKARDKRLASEMSQYMADRLL